MISIQCFKGFYRRFAYFAYLAYFEELVRLVLSTLPVPGSDVSDASDASDARPPLELGPRPAAVLTRRPSWQGPVAQSLCRASGLPALLDVCGRAMK